jgi:hypothetical protein
MTESKIDLYVEFFALTDALTEVDVPYAVCGGIAVAFHGYPRFTHDIDLLILPEDEHRVLAVAATRQFLFQGRRIPIDSNGVTDWEIARFSKIIGQELLPLDLLLVGPSIQSVWDSRGWVELEGRRIPFVSRAGLKRLKEISGRRQDLLDLEKLGLI